MNAKLQAKLADLPMKPGVYMYRSETGEIIYIGKAARLRNRVRQYFQASRLRDAKTDALVAEISELDWIETDSEIDALFLESEMVKRYLPRYNVLLRDDKAETFVRVDMQSPWPTVTLTRSPGDDGAEYVGPFYNSYSVRKALRYLRRAFPYFTRLPKDTDSRLERQIGLVPSRDGPLAMKAYKKDLRQLIRYIKGERKALVKQLEADMKRAADSQQFEEAARLRNQLRYMSDLQQRVMFGDSEYLDISKDIALTDLAKLLGIGEELRRIECVDISHHSGSGTVAALVVFVNGVSSRSDYRKFRLSDRNDDYANMADTLMRRFSVNNLQKWPLPQLLIVDGGKGQLSAALAAAKQAGVELPIIGLTKDREEIIVASAELSDLVNQAAKAGHLVVTKTGDYIAINLNPGGRKSSGHARNIRSNGQPSLYSEVTKLLQRIRDEAHRFAINYHHTVQAKSTRSGKLLSIPGVGPATQRKLMQTFGSASGVAKATLAELAVVVGENKARTIKDHLGGS